MGAVEDKEHEGGAAGWKLTGTMSYVARSRWRGGMYGPASGIWSELTLHRGAAAAGEADHKQPRDTPFVYVSLLYLLYYYRRTIWGRRDRG